MNKRNICTLLCISLLISMVFLTGCQGKEKAEAPSNLNSVDIILSIDYPKSAEIEDVTEVVFTIEEDSSVLEAIQLYCNVGNIPVTIETTGGTVVGINDLLNGDIFASRTWQFKVNGIFPNKPAGEVILKDGDTLEWVYCK